MRMWQAVDRIVLAFAPDHVVLQRGVDDLAGDPIGAWNWSLGGEGGSPGLLYVYSTPPQNYCSLVAVRCFVDQRGMAPHMPPRWIQSSQHCPCVGNAHLNSSASGVIGDFTFTLLIISRTE